MRIFFLLSCLFFSAKMFAQSAARTWEKEDKMALSISNQDAKSVASLVIKIKTFKTDEWGKFRIAFRWITEHITYDVPSFLSGKIKASTPDKTMILRKGVCQDYSDLLKAIADGLGIKCDVVSGYAKGYGYKEGDHFKDTNHAWNVAEFDGQKYLFDATWAAGSGDDKGRYHKRFEKFFFASNPDEFIFSHLPKEDQWQLTKNPISMEEFERRRSIQVSLFNIGLTLDSLRSICPSFQCDFVSVNPIVSTIGIEQVKIPFQKTLSNGKAYSFMIYSPKGSEFFVSNARGNDHTKENKVEMWDDSYVVPVPMVFKKGMYKAIVTVKTGDLYLYRTVKGKNDYLFLWNVK